MLIIIKLKFSINASKSGDELENIILAGELIWASSNWYLKAKQTRGSLEPESLIWTTNVNKQTFI